VSLLCVLVLTPHVAAGQETRIERTASTVEGWFERPLHPVINNVGPSGGFGVGIGYDLPNLPAGWFAGAEAVVTVRKYWDTTVNAGYARDRLRAEAFARIREMTQLNFFGLGAQSARANRTNFALRDQVIGTLGSFRVAPWIGVGWRVEQLWPEIGQGRSSTRRTVEELFADEDAPGLAVQPGFGHYRVVLDLAYPDLDSSTAGGNYRIGWSVFNDEDLDRYGFRRFDVELQERFPAPGPNARLTMHGLVSITGTPAGNEVPFYFQQTLGGKSSVRGFHERALGSDGTAATLRGFKNLRFRNRNLLLLQAEYGWHLWENLYATVFADAGKVAHRVADLHFDGLEHSYGFSLSYMRGDVASVRMDVGLGGEEGAQLLFSLGAFKR